ncbi:hypothetical protein BA763_22510 [Burkholderia cenocepacia]|nr:hypothetical protein BA763_22510 [Burkholderia cenocepacia]
MLARHFLAPLVAPVREAEFQIRMYDALSPAGDLIQQPAEAIAEPCGQTVRQQASSFSKPMARCVPRRPSMRNLRRAGWPARCEQGGKTAEDAARAALCDNSGKPL